MAKKTPKLSEFIDVEQRRESQRRNGGFRPIASDATVAVYDVKGGYRILTVRLSLEAAERLRLSEGMRMTCHIHPDGTHIALRAAASKSAGSGLFRPKGSRSLIYQSSLKPELLEPQTAKPTRIEDQDGVLILEL